METNEIIDRLGENNILAVPYRRAPNGVNNFGIGVAHNPEAFRVWSGRTADVEVIDGDPDRKQALIHVAEGARAISRNVTANGMFVGNNKRPSDTEFTRRFPIQIPRARFSVTGIKRTDGMLHGSQYGSFTATVTARAQASQQTLLVGMDEVAYFVAALPKNAKSIGTAHKVLRPAGLSKEAKRQGEWFFTPITAAERDAINKHIARGKAEIRHDAMEWRGGAPSSHRTTLMMVPGLGRFATGVVTDSRSGHHAPLDLGDWHRVTRNAEVIVEQTRQTRRWD